MSEHGLERRDPSGLAPSEYHVRREHEEPGEQLRQSVQSVGIVEPPIGRYEGDDLRLIDGVRRARAAAARDVEEIPVLVRCLDDAEALAQSIELNRRAGTASNKRVSDSDRDRALEQLSSRLDADRDNVEREIGLLSEADLIERELDNVPGVGRTIADRLADRWTLEELRDPGEHTPVSGVRGVGDSLAGAIHEEFNPPVRADGGEPERGVERLADGGDPRGGMDIKPHSGDPVREAINRSEFQDVMAYGEVAGHEILVHAYVSSVDTPTLDVFAGGRWESETEEYVGGRAVTEHFDRLWDLDEAFGELLREHDLDYVEADRDE